MGSNPTRPIALAALAVIATLAAGVAPARAATAAGPTPQALEAQGVHTIVVRREPGLSAAERSDLRRDAGVRYLGTLRLPETEVVRAPDGELADALRRLNADPDVRYAEPNGIVRAATLPPPDDPYWPDMWALQNTGQFVRNTTGTAGADIRALDAWQTSIGTGQTVAVTDLGIDFDQPDLQGQIAVNGGEIGGDRQVNGVDDDHDGLIDDWIGWDFVDGDNKPAEPDGAFHGHGTHVSGIIAAARGNQAGVSGIAPGARVLPLRVLDETGEGTPAQVASGFDLAGDLGVPVVNASLSSQQPSQVEADAIAAHPRTLYVIAAGNNGQDIDAGDQGVFASYPCESQAANVICVGATDQNDQRATYSNSGATSVDLFAPGSNIRSTVLGGAYEFKSGTSMATPYVSGTLALMRAANPALTAGQLKRLLLGSVDVLPALAGKAVTGGRLDAAAAVAAAAAFVPDGDEDGVPDATDRCPSIADPAQPDADGDGIGDACDLTPHGDPPPPPPAPPARTTPTPTPPVPPGDGSVTAQQSRAPVLTAVSLRGTRLVACRPKRRACADRRAALRFTLDRAAVVRVRYQARTVRRRGARRIVVWRTRRTLLLHAHEGRNQRVISARPDGRALAAGSYRLAVQALDGTLRSVTATYRVRIAR